MGTYLATTESYLRLALKAQAQSRATVKALAEMKNPHPVSFVKHLIHSRAAGPRSLRRSTGGAARLALS